MQGPREYCSWWIIRAKISKAELFDPSIKRENTNFIVRDIYGESSWHFMTFSLLLLLLFYPLVVLSSVQLQQCETHQDHIVFMSWKKQMDYKRFHTSRDPSLLWSGAKLKVFITGLRKRDIFTFGMHVVQIYICYKSRDCIIFLVFELDDRDVLELEVQY